MTFIFFFKFTLQSLVKADFLHPHELQLNWLPPPLDADIEASSLALADGCNYIKFPSTVHQKKNSFIPRLSSCDQGYWLYSYCSVGSIWRQQHCPLNTDLAYSMLIYEPSQLHLKVVNLGHIVHHQLQTNHTLIL